MAFENSNVPDYVTEKYWTTLVAGSVPVYYGATNVQDFAPSNSSVINVADFRTVILRIQNSRAEP